MKRAKMLFILLMIVITNFYFATNIKAEEKFAYKGSCEYVSLDGRYGIELEKNVKPSSNIHDDFFDYFVWVDRTGKYYSFENQVKSQIHTFYSKEDISFITNYDNINDIAKCDEFITYNVNSKEYIVRTSLDKIDKEEYTDASIYSLKKSTYKYFPDVVSCNYEYNGGGFTPTKLKVVIKRDGEKYKFGLYNGDKKLSGVSYYGADQEYAGSLYIDKLVEGCPQYLHVRDYLGYRVIMTNLDKGMALVGRTSPAFWIGMGAYKDSVTFELYRTQEEKDKLTKTVVDGTSLLGSLNLQYQECKNSGDINCEPIKEQANKLSESLDDVCYVITTSDDFDQNSKTSCANYVEVRDKLESAGIIASFEHGCNMLSEKMKDFINWILSLVKIAGPIIVIVFGTMDFVKAATSNEADSNKKAFDKFIKRLLMAAVIFLIPALVQFIFNYFNIFTFAGGLEPSNPFCL